MTYKILIADDHSIVRSGIKALVKNNFNTQTIDEASCEEEIVERMKACAYELIMLDINIPDMDFAGMMSWLKVTSPKTSILIFSMHTEDTYGKRSLQLGANGYLHKAASNDEIILAIKKVLEGDVYTSKTLRDILSKSDEENNTANPFTKLSAREMEIALLINKGHSLSQICSSINIQYSTANTYKRRIFEKLNVTNAVSLSHLMQVYKVGS